MKLLEFKKSLDQFRKDLDSFTGKDFEPFDSKFENSLLFGSSISLLASVDYFLNYIIKAEKRTLEKKKAEEIEPSEDFINRKSMELADMLIKLIKDKK